MELKELYEKKGMAVTQMEILQGQLQQLNNEIAKILNKQKPEEAKSL